MPNPFFYGGRIENPKDFIGRKAELRVIFSALEHFSDGQAQHISMVGERRIGKSSLLYHVTKIYSQRLKYPEKYRFVFVDLDDPHNHTLHGLLSYILNNLGLPPSKNITLSYFTEAFEKFHNQDSLCPVICLDEFEHLANRKDEFPNDVYEAFRSLGSNNKLAFITASKSPLSDLIHQSNMTSTFPNIFIQRQLSEFNDDEVKELLNRAEPPFAAEEKEQILHLAGHHPAKLQIAASIVHDARESGRIDWNKVKKEYEQESNNLVAKSDKAQQTKTLSSILRMIFISFPTSLGRFFLELFNNNAAGDQTAGILGWVIILLFLAVVFGFINLQPFITAWLRKGSN